MRIKVSSDRAVTEGQFPGLQTVAPMLEGTRRWLKVGGLSFEPTRYNLDILIKAFPGIVVEGPEAYTTFLGARELPATPQDTAPAPPLQILGRPDYKGQAKAKAKMTSLWDRGGFRVFALFSEMGTGKTKVAIDMAVDRHARGEIDAVLVVAMKGVHKQWVMDALPENLGPSTFWRGHAWAGKTPPQEFATKDKLNFFTINVDAVRTDKGLEACRTYINHFKGRVMMIIDESQTIKNHRSQSWEVCNKLGQLCKYRIIMTGTPIAKDLTDEWSQFKWLNERIIGMRYQTAFRHQYCIMGGWEGKKVVAHKNIDHFYSLVEPYSFRVTKDEELELPPKVYKNFVFELTEEQRFHFNNLKTLMLTQMKNGEIRTVKGAAEVILRLHQVTCGYMPHLDGTLQRFEKNPRLDALDEVLQHRTGKIAIWCRFTEDLRLIKEKYGARCMLYYGATNNKDREKAKAAIIDPENSADIFLSNPAAGGTGIDGLQRTVRTAIYYSNSYRAIDRWQSEDRTHRAGMTGTCTYIDLIAHKGVDRGILANLRRKKSLSDLTLDDIRRIVESDE